VNGEDFAGMLVPGLDGEGGEGGVEELDGAVPTGGEELVFVGLGEGEVEEGVLSVEPAHVFALLYLQTRFYSDL